mmetsp:Transcript_24415/g.26939  ORF Transcript_24415/g.26939 Transcript_24415/m.26939 type:complete len:214 (+) Transcript_24415:236-877(+)|eukprot:CAMPEP_0194145932 /NCGR_PEP_ID=MMETSP0152-20130528/18920_1 /TAXON_ID=1049557 /ORGANISM="Thalassiothrix antarctica, Strain L6-D1" /LENGTH=213 /DNA_ID=CAMNT_0038846303 /DNA_START=210 /DNA_END=851 /DNA_ORIENTATION=-
MGSAFSNCSDSNENEKTDAFQATNTSIDIEFIDDNDKNRKTYPHGGTSTKNNSGHIECGGGSNILCSVNHNCNTNITKKQREKEKEEARLQLIVSSAGRDMVSIQSTRGATFYHDQGFAAALSQHLQQTLPSTSSHPNLPCFVSPSLSSTITRSNGREGGNNSTNTNNDLLSVLSRPLPADNGGLWEMEVVNEAIITKEQLFANCPQIVENLL